MGRVVIVGAGPAGLFAANELIDKVDVIVIDKRKLVGGAGLVIDGKFNFHPQIGGNLTEFVPQKEAWGIMNQIDETFEKYGVSDDYYDEERLNKLAIKTAKAGIRLIKIKQKHIGSDRLPEIMKEFKHDLESRGVEFKLDTKAQDLTLENNSITEIITDKENIKCDHVLLSPGRSGYSWIKDQCDKLGVEVKFNPLDVGVRVEVRNEIMKEIVEDFKCHDPKFHIRTPTHEDFVRTFCVCYRGYVTKEHYEKDLWGVNGHSYSKSSIHSENTNFAFLVSLGLTEPKEDTTEYGFSIARQANTLAGKRPLIQRVGDLKKGKRSTWDRIERSYVKPTLTDATPGDISMALPGRIMTDITEGLKMLNRVIPGVHSDSTLLYAPEIKFYARRVVTNGLLQTKIPNLFVAGDGAGVSRGIVGAAATGMIAARGIKASAR